MLSAGRWTGALPSLGASFILYTNLCSGCQRARGEVSGGSPRTGDTPGREYALHSYAVVHLFQEPVSDLLTFSLLSHWNVPFNKKEGARHFEVTKFIIFLYFNLFDFPILLINIGSIFTWAYFLVFISFGTVRRLYTSIHLFQFFLKLFSFLNTYILEVQYIHYIKCHLPVFGMHNKNCSCSEN